MGFNIPTRIMFKKLLVIIPLAIFFGTVQVEAMTAVLPQSSSKMAQQKEIAEPKTMLAQDTMNLNTRYPVPSVNAVFKDNILLNLAYLSGKVKNANDINWDEVRKPSTSEFTLQPGEVFAFHEDVLPQYEGKVVKTTGAHFGGEDGFLSDGYLYGDGVCHFASLINWAARDAGLEVVAPTNHNFAVIPEMDPFYGTSIYYAYGQKAVNMQQNLYVTNNLDKPVKFVFESNGDSITVKIYK